MKIAGPFGSSETVSYGKALVVMEGKLSLFKSGYNTPIDCTCGCNPNKSWKPVLIGGVKFPTGATDIDYLHKVLLSLNDKNIKITVEWT